MSQRYQDALSFSRMEQGRCPECGGQSGSHSADQRFWLPRTCDLTPIGVWDRIMQYREDNRDRTGPLVDFEPDSVSSPSPVPTLQEKP